MDYPFIIEKINQAYVNIQSLSIQPSKTNCGLIMGALTALDGAAQGFAEMQNRIHELEEKNGEQAENGPENDNPEESEEEANNYGDEES